MQCAPIHPKVSPPRLLLSHPGISVPTSLDPGRLLESVCTWYMQPAPSPPPNQSSSSSSSSCDLRRSSSSTSSANRATDRHPQHRAHGEEDHDGPTVRRVSSLSVGDSLLLLGTPTWPPCPSSSSSSSSLSRQCLTPSSCRRRFGRNSGVRFLPGSVGGTHSLGLFLFPNLGISKGRSPRVISCLSAVFRVLPSLSPGDDTKISLFLVVLLLSCLGSLFNSYALTL